MRTSNRRRILLCLLASALLHLLALLTVPRLDFQETPLLRLVRFQPELEEPVRFEPKRALGGPTPRTWMERLVVEGRPTELRVPAVQMVPRLEAPELPGPVLSQDQPRLFGEKGDQFEAPVDSLITIEALNLAMLQQRLEELAGYERQWLPDADTGDEESAARQQGQEVVLAAVAAMGGVRALNQLQGMSLGPVSEPGFQALASMTRFQTEVEVQERLRVGRSFFRKHGLRSQFARYLPGGARLVYDGERAWMVLSGARHPVEGESFRVVQNRAERWDFLSRYMGDGLQVTYLGSQANAAGREFAVIRVEDFKFGGVSFRSLFDAETHLPVAEEYPAEEPTLQYRFLEYREEGEAFIWHQVETRRLQARTWPDTLAVGYDAVPDEIFGAESVEPAWMLDRIAEFEGMLWVTARFGNMPYNGVPVVTRGSLGLVSEKIGKEYRQQVLRDTAMYYLSYEQKRLVEEQVRSIAIEEMRKQNFFSRVEPLADGAPIKEGDYVLEIRPLRKITPQEIRGRVFYGAEMIAAVTRETVMRDGPLPAFYFGVRWGGSRTGQDASMRPDCRFYRMPVYIVETSDVAYVSEERLRERLRRTGDKSGVAVRAHRQGKPLRLTDECCYCQ